jgi:BirA family biotin operon repressor/biotin-[acetyl-CoA-carboxylase] ligase
MGSALLKLKKEGFLPWKNEWLQMENFLGKKACVVEFGNSISGTIYNINDDGSLLFQKEDGEIITVYAGDLEI